MTIERLEAELIRLTATSCRMAIAVHTESGSLEINGNSSFRAASLMKLFILGEYYRQAENGHLDPEEVIRIRDHPSVKGAGILSCLSGPPDFTMQQLAELMIIVSDNMASNILLNRMGMDSVNRFIQEIGLENTVLHRVFMDVDAQSAGLENNTTAEDVTRLLKLFAYPNEFLAETSRLEIMHILRNQQFNDKLTKWISSAEGLLIHHKTGELPGIEHDAAIFTSNGKIAIITVLTEGSGTRGEAQQLIAEAGHWTAELLF